MHFTLFQKIGLSVLFTAWILFFGYHLANNLIKVDDSNIEALRIVPINSDVTPPAPTTAPAEADAVTVQSPEPTITETAAIAQSATTLTEAANIEAGMKVAKKCKSCHSFEEGGKHKVGPNLWAIIDRKQASAEGYKYSSALSDLGGTWSDQALLTFLSNPAQYAPGTKMKFKGLSKESDRAALLSYLRTFGGGTQSEAAAVAEPIVEVAAEPVPEPETAAVIEPAPEPVPEPVSEPEPEPDLTKTTDPAGNLGALMRAADINVGQSLTRVCKACHSLDYGAKHKVGPNMWNIIGRQQGRLEGFRYSNAFKALDGIWTFEELDKFLTNPAGYAPGTKMKYKGIKKASDRAALLRFLRSQSDSPVPMP